MTYLFCTELVVAFYHNHNKYMQQINYITLLISALVGFGIGSFWYSPFLFGKEWMEGRNISKDDIKTNSVFRSYIVQFISSVITFFVLGFIINSVGVTNSSEGAFIGALAWLGFIIPTSISGLLWKKESWTLFLIDTVYYLLILTIGGAILGAWR